MMFVSNTTEIEKGYDSIFSSRSLTPTIQSPRCHPPSPCHLHFYRDRGFLCSPPVKQTTSSWIQSLLIPRPLPPFYPLTTSLLADDFLILISTHKDFTSWRARPTLRGKGKQQTLPSLLAPAWVWGSLTP